MPLRSKKLNPKNRVWPANTAFENSKAKNKMNAAAESKTDDRPKPATQESLVEYVLKYGRPEPPNQRGLWLWYCKGSKTQRNIRPRFCDIDPHTDRLSFMWPDNRRGWTPIDEPVLREDGTYKGFSVSSGRGRRRGKERNLWICAPVPAFAVRVGE